MMISPTGTGREALDQVGWYHYSGVFTLAVTIMNIMPVHRRLGGDCRRSGVRKAPDVKRWFAVALALTLASCATPAQRITAKLTEYGVPPRQAQCMGERLDAYLDTRQLRRLGEIGRTNRDRMGRMTVNDIVAMLDKPGDEAIVTEVVRSGIGCLL